MYAKKKVYEAKFNYKSSGFSVEFDLDGDIANVEILLNQKDLNSSDVELMNKTLSENFSDFKLLKIQREYIGDDDLFSIIKGESAEDVEVKYELEINIRKNKRRKLYEVILDEDFELIRKRRIKLQSTDILDY
jgi:hypothetical protein